MTNLRIVKACLPGREGLWEIGVTDGVVTQVDRSVAGDTTLDALGQLVIPGLVDAHIHLDKVFLLDRCPRIEGTFREAMRETLKAKQAFTIADIQARARQALQQAISWGTTTMRSHRCGRSSDPVDGDASAATIATGIRLGNYASTRGICSRRHYESTGHD